MSLPAASLSNSSSHSNSQSLSVSRSTSRVNPSSGQTFRDDRENYHRVEFEAPLSAEIEGQHQVGGRGTQGRFSIDLSLELERELANMESPPVTPGYDSMTHAHEGEPGHAHNGSDLSPDPEILAHIVTQLRQSLADMTQERDDLVKLLAEANHREAVTQDALQALTDKATGAEEERVEMRKKMKDDEEQIVMLRAKVEESRRGLMRLQTEQRRQSMAPIDISRASSMTLGSFTSPPSSKRASFVPLTGSMQGRPSSHKRGVSVSDSHLGSFPSPDLTPSPNSQAFHIAAAEASLTGNSRRLSGLFGRQPSPENDPQQFIVSAQPSNSAEFESLRKELQAVKDELETTKHELIEAKEAKEASETCVTALREFIAENNVGANEPNAAVKLPPPPTMTTGAEESSDSKKTATGWGFKLWGSSSSGVDSLRMGAVPQSATVTSSSSNMALSLPDPPPSAMPIGAAPVSRKLGGFFGSRSSISSREAPSPKLSQLQTNAAAMRTPSGSMRDSVYSHSDASSVAEPISPGSDINGLGNAGYLKAAGLGEDIMVHEVTNLDGTPVRVAGMTLAIEARRL
ncbi:hypothetical protein CPB84DRAFT_1815644 [Gymnopilus junonius]|uniref:Uncharacterized protein n=1 Tax=Gymnopilus junonius TaxID=109634 RepID=A0A9P5NMG5_GYMJU|nr:hypothetical protein CPB84DRAFT_1815644 [Gymnopilus junonius]